MSVVGRIIVRAGAGAGGTAGVQASAARVTAPRRRARATEAGIAAAGDVTHRARNARPGGRSVIAPDTVACRAARRSCSRHCNARLPAGLWAAAGLRAAAGISAARRSLR